MNEEMVKNKKIFKVGKSRVKYGNMRVSFTVGASYKGLIPVCEFIIWNFAFQAIDHIINANAKMQYMSGGMIGSSI